MEKVNALPTFLLDLTFDRFLFYQSITSLCSGEYSIVEIFARSKQASQTP